MNKDIFKLPNILTLLRIILSVGLFVVLFFGMAGDAVSHVSVFIVYILIALTDAVDGIIARKFNMVTELGKDLDPLADKVLVWLMLLTFVRSGYVSAWLVFPVFLRDIYVNFIRKRCREKKINFVTSNIAKAKTAVQMIFIGLVLVIPAVLEYKNITMGWYADLNNFLYGMGMDISMAAVMLFTLYTALDYTLTYIRAQHEQR